ncbi:MAG: K(+)-transporting ATPase subunit C [Nitrosomonadales bacterium]
MLTLLTGIAYPLVVTGVSQVIMPAKANGSMIMKDGKPIGSSLMGQSFSDPKYFWSRPSATSPMPNNPTGSSGSNLGANQSGIDGCSERAECKPCVMPIPAISKRFRSDLVTASASGLDPHISPAAAYYQVARVARVRNFSPDVVGKLVAEHTEGRQFGIWVNPG